MGRPGRAGVKRYYNLKETRRESINSAQNGKSLIAYSRASTVTYRSRGQCHCSRVKLLSVPKEIKLVQTAK
jgi:hypothetical protein